MLKVETGSLCLAGAVKSICAPHVGLDFNFYKGDMLFAGRQNAGELCGASSLST
ncbi:MAG: hypothetical protein KBA08_11170 [Firmicutes bacterium]|nr:hypothetical protein [Bacillota bacterium]